jgi:DNA-binding transcriptional LysR family regulator
LPDRRPVLRLGYHGSPLLPMRIAAAAGRPDRVELGQYDITDPFRALRAGDLDVMIIKFRVREPDLVHSAVLATDGRAAVLGARHPLAGRSWISVEELAGFPAFRCPRAFPGYVWDQVVPPATPAGRPIRRRHELRSTAQMMDLVTRGSAVHLSLLSLADVAPPAVRVVPVPDLPPAPVALAWRRDLDPARADAVRGLVKDAESALAAVAR